MKFLTIFFAYKALVEKQYGHQIQKLRTDNGGKYVNTNFTSYCTTQVIQMQHTVPYTPQQIHPHVFPLLRPPNYNKDFLLFLDVTESTIGMVLVQEDDFLEEHIIYYLI